MTIETSGAASMLREMQAMAGQAGGQQPTAPQTDGVSFGDALKHSIDRIDALKDTAQATGQAFERGEPGVGVNDVMVNMAKADVATNMGIQTRNRVVSAYRDIMNMQV